MYDINFPLENFLILHICTYHVYAQRLISILAGDCLTNVFLSLFLTGPNCSDLKQPMYLGFEKDVFKTIADYYGHLKEPLLTFHLFDAFVSVLGKLEYSEHISTLLMCKHFIFLYLETSVSTISIVFLK